MSSHCCLLCGHTTGQAQQVLTLKNCPQETGWRSVVYYAQTAHAFGTGISCWHCINFMTDFNAGFHDPHLRTENRFQSTHAYLYLWSLSYSRLLKELCLLHGLDLEYCFSSLFSAIMRLSCDNPVVNIDQCFEYVTNDFIDKIVIL